jgi:hypothetical protein
LTVAAHVIATCARSLRCSIDARRFDALGRLSVVAILAFVSCLPIVSKAQPVANPAQSSPTAADSDFWRSAERIGTVDAMRAYLKAYPQGFYADLARAAIDRMQAKSPGASTPSKPPMESAVAAPSSPTGLSVDPMQVLSGTPTSGAITMLPGEVYHGPGPITVGYLGAKKQLVLPNGAWVLLAVADRQSGHRPSVPLVSMVFGQFREGHLVSLMSYLFNGRTSPMRTWQEVEDCHAEKKPNGSIGHTI